ncbi:hypothetical protein Gbem_2358 [Citrifermentans bemidjiense Bem]|uniref:Uncharacterized protein n=1 Tax=Citrifermentans bemidjiense (strain ATCC BAA-1014 / DSM 16622 / JCM 12645 / Bem) TaxID=404380 RepID=B5EF61_CITBB|nr:hypothetical protein [Citrifermentans bemidjiense]ACH39370.1 hypothetical protein Gbem_2358 [Citrifermentans bemidjiense Bem]
MRTCCYTAMNGEAKVLKLDSAIDIAVGHSSRRSGWSATLLFNPATLSFIEYRCSPPDQFGQRREEAEEVTSHYIYKNFKLDPILLLAIQQNPQEWKAANHAE